MVISSPSDGSAGSHRLLVERAVARFRKAFAAEPTHVAFAPGRVNLIGDHTDYAGGLVFPAALEEGCVCALAPADGVFAAVSDDLDGEVAVVDASGRFTPHDLTGSPSWMRYAAGTFEIMRRRFAPDAGGARLAVASDVPAGGGLSSSAALEVSIATALEAMWSLDIDPVAKAEACQQAEHTFAGAPCGLMDQLVSVVGRTGQAIQIDFGRGTRRAVPLPPPGLASFVLFDSGVRHANDDGGYAARRAACESALPKLGVPALGVLGPERLADLPTSLTTEERDAAVHVVTENHRVRMFCEHLSQLRLAEAGELMTESHASLAEVYRVSCPQVDALVEIVSSQPGVFGARMTGGGFGGWIVALVEADKLQTAANSSIAEYRARTELDSAYRVVRAGPGAGVLERDVPIVAMTPALGERVAP